MSNPIFQVDAFTDAPFRGNPAAVCLLLDGEKNAQWLQQVAAEMNLSETAFLSPQDKGWGLRWFTPTTEVDLCGHATLASAYVLFDQGLVPRSEVISFYTLSGVLRAQANGPWLELDFPAERPWAEAIDPKIIKALGAQPIYTGRNRLDQLVAVETEAEVLALKPDFEALSSLGERGVIVTAPATRPGYDFVSRYFGPGVGINEDPVTGSAHCCLGPYWQDRLHKTVFTAWQASSRGGAVKVRLQGERVILGGQGAMVLAGQLF